MPLLYRATRDGFKAEHFRAKCEEKGATLTLVKVRAMTQLRCGCDGAGCALLPLGAMAHWV